MKKYAPLVFLLLFSLFPSKADALNLSRVKTWSASEILTAADLNAEFNNILNHSLTNNDIDAAAGIVGSKLDLSSPGTIGNTTASTGAFTTLSASGALDVTGITEINDKLAFTQDDQNEYIDSLTDGELDFNATISLNFLIGGTEQVQVFNGDFRPTTDNDIDLGTSGLEFKDLFIDGTGNIDSLVADTADVNGGTLDGVQIGGATTTGTIFYNDASDDAVALVPGADNTVLTSTGTSGVPAWETIGLSDNTQVTFTTAASSGDIAIVAGLKYRVFIRITAISSDGVLWLRFNNDSGASVYAWERDESTLGGTAADANDTSDSEIEICGLDSSDNRAVVILDFNNDDSGNLVIISATGYNDAVDNSGGIAFKTIGRYNNAGTDATVMEIHASTGTITGTIDFYGYN